MLLNIKYFGLIAELTHCNEEALEFSYTTIADLKEALIAKYPDLKAKDFQIAQNKEIVSNNATVSGDEIALLPPFSGG
ncbi:MAG: MoaD/ThiS family protein [Flavobacteriaceae bacterium]